ncbi:Sec-independent protein translocase protein TatB [Methylomonas methanica]|uniref:Sec-independent protein translocase protein TatB n=1 Tax=Methylomonas methanica (strain DSM 25384 / MC09) TaxID=857087 RepID=G0A5R6_METMM|nr:Sec-independent protein translocase protein TatB [Methylomonas methanica]AEG02923.1 Sec-independent protein translocase protein tatB-like protein [Methylomonas methanica MC09]
MFDVGFSELVMVGLIALLVIGPERLPKAARIAGYWLGKTRSAIANVKAEIKQELHAEEMRQLLNQQESIASELQQIASETETVVDDINNSIKIGDKTSQNHDPSA